MKDQYQAIHSLATYLQYHFETETDDGRSEVSSDKVAERPRFASLYSHELYKGLEELDRCHLIRGVVDGIAEFISSIKSIKMEMNCDQNTKRPMTPMDVITSESSDFGKLLRLHTKRLNGALGNSAGVDVWRQREQLIHRYRQDSTFRRSVDSISAMPVDAAWAVLDAGKDFKALTSFVVGLAAIPPCTQTVEGDFSHLKAVKSAQRSARRNYTLEGQMQAGQYFGLVSLATGAIPSCSSGAKLNSHNHLFYT